MLYRLDVPLPPASLRIVVFWALFFVAMSIGTMTEYVIGAVHNTGLFLHDITAYVLMASLGFFLTVEPQAETRLHRICWLLVVLGSLILALQLAHAWGIIGFQQIEPWFWHRLRGWSENANALALLCLVLALLSFHLVATCTRYGTKIMALACAILPIWVGILTDSDAFIAAIVFSCAIFVVLKFWNSLYSQSGNLSIASLSVLVIALALPVFLAFASPIGYMLVRGVERDTAMVSSAKYGALENDGEERFYLWGQALKRTANTGMLGLGPGPHLERPPRQRVPAKEPSMELAAPPPNVEAHNTLLDLFIQGGMIAGISIIWLGTTTVLTIVRAGKQVLAALLFGIAVFGVTHFIIRYPIVWFVVAFCLVAKDANLRPSRAAAWS